MSTTSRERHSCPTVDKSSVLAEREKWIESHPVKEGDYTVPTPPIQRAYDAVTRMMISSGRGMSFIAHSCFGKSCCIDYLARRLPARFPGIPIVTYNAHSSVRPEENRFFGEIYFQGGYAYGYARRRGDDMRHRVVQAWKALASAKSSGALLFIGDEMQELSETEFTWLRDTGNDLAREGIRVISVLFGDPMLKSLRDVLLQAGRTSIIGRFMARVLPFEGIRSERELAEVLAHYDCAPDCEYPPGSRCSYTEFFLPRSFANGLRLKSSASVLWRQFALQARVISDEEKKIPPGFTVGMQWIAQAVNCVLVNSMDADYAHFKITKDDWCAAIATTDFSDHVGVTYDPMKSEIDTASRRAS